jgi:tetratricopeptide (TPR) repeat protein
MPSAAMSASDFRATAAHHSVSPPAETLRLPRLALGPGLAVALALTLAGPPVAAEDVQVPPQGPHQEPRQAVEVAPSAAPAAPGEVEADSADQIEVQDGALDEATDKVGDEFGQGVGEGVLESVGESVGQAVAPVEEAGRDGLDPDLVYAVLVAELAGRGGDMATAFSHYMHAAQLARDASMAELAVRAAVAGKDEEGAQRAIALWLSIEPASVSAHQVAALLRLQAQDREGALTHLARVVALAGADAAAGYGHAIGIIGRAASVEERVELMRALVELDAHNPEAHHALAVVAAAGGDLSSAETAARSALELRPGWAKPQLLLVRLLISAERREEARALLEEFVAASPDDEELRMLYGQLLVEEEEYVSARTEFERLLNGKPKDPDALFALGILSLQLEDIDQARIYLTRLYQTGVRRDEATYYLGQVEEEAENFQAALDWYAKTGDANDVEAQVRAALIHAKLGDVDRAREIVQQLRDQSPGNAEGLYLVEAEILEEVGRPDQVLGVYEAALAAFPDSAELRYARAMYAVKGDLLDLAESDLRAIIDSNPDHADALNALGYTLADRTDRLEEARELIEKAHALKPDEPAILDSMGWVQYRLGNLEVALDYLRRALDAMSDGEIAAHLGEVLWAMGRRDEAWQVWEAALEDHPEHDYLSKVVSRYRLTRVQTAP